MFVQNVMVILPSVVETFPSQTQMSTSRLHSRKSRMIGKLNFFLCLKTKMCFLLQAHSACDLLFPSQPQPLSLSFSFWRWPLGAVSLLWSSSSSSFCPAGGAGRGDRGTGTRRIPAKKEKTPLCGKTKRKERGERKRGIERGRRITHFVSRSLA